MTSGGAATVPLAVPAGAWNVGIELFFQYLILDFSGPMQGVASSSDGLRIRIGRS